MILDNFPKVLWINLDQSLDRREYMNNLLNDYELNHQRVKAIDGKKSIDHLCITSPNITKKEAACSVSHLLTIHLFLSMYNPYVIIFEDDVSFEFLKHIPYNWSDLIKSLPKDWQVVQLAVSELVPTIDLKLTRNKPNDGRYCSSAYLINKSGAQSIISQYYHPTLSKYVLKHKYMPTADNIICNSCICYSIPIFSYLTESSTIHDKHLSYHKTSKDHQLSLWKSISHLN